MPRQIQNQQKAYWLGFPIVNAFVFLTLFALPLLFWGSYTLNFHKESARISESANDVVQDVSKKIAEVKTLMASLVGLHYASENLQAHELMLFSKELRAQNSFISGVGRYEKIQNIERVNFETRMSETGLFDFKITDIQESGPSIVRDEYDHYYPTSMLEPIEPGNLKMLGADLGSVTDLIGMLDYIMAENDTLLSTFPDNWPLGGDLVLFRPVYLGKQAPLTEAERSQQSAGGFWISLDLSAMVDAINQKIRTFDVDVSIVEGESEQQLFAQLGETDKPIFLSSIFDSIEHTEHWTTGTTSLAIRLKSNVGYTREALAYTSAAMIALLLVTGMYTAHIVARTAAKREQQLNRDALFIEREKAVTTLNSVQDAIITVDADLRVVHINPAAIIQFNTRASVAIGKALSNMVQFQLAEEKYSIFNVELALANLLAGSKREFDVTPIGCDHHDFVLRLTLSSTIDVEGNATGHVLVLRDISHERRLTNKLAYQASHDSLTGCTNRFFFEQTLAGLIDGLSFSENTHTLCYMDLDQFKVINDTCGHRAGDRLLTELTENMRMFIEDDDVLSRLGGDEFGLLMVDIDQQQAIERSNRIYQFFQNYIFHHEDKAFAVRASIGVVHIDNPADTIMDIMAAADIACYAAKDAGRNNMYVYSPTDHVMAERSVELSWLPRLQNALQNEEFKLYVQAVASIHSNPEKIEIEHFEFLLRLSGPDGSISTPWQFIQAAERYDLMREIDRWVIRNALRMVAELKGGPAQGCSFSINLSGQSAADATLKDYIREQMQYYDIDPTLIWFELTETAAISHFSTAVDLITNIQELGSKVALDDFGSGLSSFGYLKNLPVDVLKIDGQFIREVALNSIDREMVKAIHQVGQSMGIKTVAEFVENQAIVDVLIDIGIDYAQGYHIGKPCPLEEAVARLPPITQHAA